MFQIKCADCDCLPSECKVSKLGKECPNCSAKEASNKIPTAKKIANRNNILLNINQIFYKL